MGTKEEIFKRLNELTSYYSFARVLGYIKLMDSGTPQKGIESSMRPNSDRLINSEVALLAGLWIHNVDLSKHWDINEDGKYICGVYKLMNSLHLLYKPTNDTPLNSQLIEVAFYEGDGGYPWQFLNFAQKKYEDNRFSDYLLHECNLDIRFIKSTAVKINKVLEEQIRRRIEQKRKKSESLSPVNAFTITKKILKNTFTKEEQNIIESFSFKLGEDHATEIKDISDHNTFSQYPIIKLPKERGYYIIGSLALAVSMNETPFYWIQDSGKFSNGLAGSIRGSLAERIVYEIIKEKFSSLNIRKNILIKKTKSSNLITDIDVLLIDEKVCIVFQVKSKRLTELSRQGDFSSINNDFNKAVLDAYEQGKTSIACLKEYQQYYTLRNEKLELSQDMDFYNICVTLDQYPTLSSLNFFNSLEPTPQDIPLLSMSIYDLDLILYLLSKEEFIEYICFRKECVKDRIYGISEVYYLGAFINNKIDGRIFLNGYKIAREYAIFIDYIVYTAKYRRLSINSIDDIRSLLNRYPPKEPIQCQ